MKTFSYVSAVVLAAAISTTAAAETRVTYKSAKNTSSYYQMAVQIAEAMKEGLEGRHHRHRRGKPRVCSKRQGSGET